MPGGPNREWRAVADQIRLKVPKLESCRCASALIRESGARLSSTIRSFSVALQPRRRSAPEGTVLVAKRTH